MTAPANATPLERMLDAVAHLTMVADSTRAGTYGQSFDAVSDALADMLKAADACEEAWKIVHAAKVSRVESKNITDAFFDGMRHAARVVANTETPPSSVGVALALANFRAVLQRDLEGRAARREVTVTL